MTQEGVIKAAKPTKANEKKSKMFANILQAMDGELLFGPNLQPNPVTIAYFHRLLGKRDGAEGYVHRVLGVPVPPG